MIKCRYEYRINKKGAECFRSSSFESTRSKLEELKSKGRAEIYTMQARSVRLDKYGDSIRDYKGRPEWSPWS